MKYDEIIYGGAIGFKAFMVLVGAWVGHPAGAQGYKGHIGCEYQPRGKTEDGLKWLDELVE